MHHCFLYLRKGATKGARRPSKAYTRKNAQFVTKLQQTCSNADKLLEQSCVVTRLFQQLVNRMCSHCLFPACWKVVNSLLTTCYKVVELDRLVTSCSNNLLSSCNSTICQQVVSDNLVATWLNDSIVTTCWQACYKPVANTSFWILTNCKILTCVAGASAHETNWTKAFQNSTKLALMLTWYTFSGPTSFNS